MVRNLDDLLYYDGFMGFEISNYVNTGHGFGGKRGNKIFGENIKMYDDMVHDNKYEKFQYKTTPIVTTEMLMHYGLKLDGTMQKIKDVVIFPNEYFDPALQIPIKCSYSVHKYSSLWSFKEKNMEKVWEEQRRYYYQLLDNGRIKEFL